MAGGRLYRVIWCLVTKKGHAIYTHDEGDNGKYWREHFFHTAAVGEDVDKAGFVVKYVVAYLLAMLSAKIAVGLRCAISLQFVRPLSCTQGVRRADTASSCILSVQRSNEFAFAHVSQSLPTYFVCYFSCMGEAVHAAGGIHVTDGSFTQRQACSTLVVIGNEVVWCESRREKHGRGGICTMIVDVIDAEAAYKIKRMVYIPAQRAHTCIRL